MIQLLLATTATTTTTTVTTSSNTTFQKRGFILIPTQSFLFMNNHFCLT